MKKLVFSLLAVVDGRRRERPAASYATLAARGARHE
jgi:hypothetical protein